MEAFETVLTAIQLLLLSDGRSPLPSPPSDVRESTIIGSTSSPGLASFDLHLHEDLRLKRVVLVPDLAIQIGEHANILLERYGDRLPDEKGPLPKKYPTMEP